MGSNRGNRHGHRGRGTAWGLRGMVLAAVVGVVLAGVAWYSGRTATAGPLVEVWKSPTCGCCSKWIDHLRANGFEVKAHDVRDVVPVKERLGVPYAMGSCHTATVEGYVIEGHVPAGSIRRLLRERPRGARGLAVPGMPVGSPGMEGPRPVDYDVVLFDGQGGHAVFERKAGRAR